MSVSVELKAATGLDLGLPPDSIAKLLPDQLVQPEPARVPNHVGAAVVAPLVEASEPASLRMPDRSPTAVQQARTIAEMRRSPAGPLMHGPDHRFQQPIRALMARMPGLGNLTTAELRELRGTAEGMVAELGPGGESTFILDPMLARLHEVTNAIDGLLIKREPSA